MKKLRHGFSKHPYIYSILITIALVLGGGIAFSRNGNDYETLTLERTTFKRQVSVSGKVIPVQSSELGFDQGGRVARVNAPVGRTVTKGMILASIENGDLAAEVLQRRAALEREQAKLASLRQGTRPEQLAIDEQKYVDAAKALVVALGKSLLQAENAMLTEIDTMFENGSSVNPSLDIRAPGLSEERKTEADRKIVTEKFTAWKEGLASISANSNREAIDAALSRSDEAFVAINTLLNDMRIVVNDLSTSNSGLEQTTIDEYRSSVNTAGQDISDAKDELDTAEAAWQNATKNLALSEAGSTPADIDAQSAAVKAAQADLLSAQARLNKTNIIAPFDGVVTRMDLKVGEIVSSNESKVSLMSNGAFEIESFVPEVHIANIRVGHQAVVNLDAYGSEVPFQATVKSLDPAETIRDGVSTYKVKLGFDNFDSRIRSGMTANVVITTLEKPSALVVPRSVIIEKDGQVLVRKLNGDDVAEVPVTLGDSTTLGQVEIVSGLDEGDTIILDETE